MNINRKFIFIFKPGIYNYFLTVQHMDTDNINRNNLLITKMSRLCLNDLSFTKSYTEVPLKCTGNGMQKTNAYSLIDYNELISAKVIQIKSNSWSHKDYYLIGLFQQTQRTTFNATLNQDGNVKQALCVFSMREIQATITKNLNKCYNNAFESHSVMRGLNFIKPDQKCSSKLRKMSHQHYTASASSVGDDFCSSADNGIYPIGGRVPAVATASIEFDTEILPEVFDSLRVWSDSVATTMILMSNKLQKVQMFNMKSPGQVELYRTVRLSDDVPSGESIKLTGNLEFDLKGLIYNSLKNII